MAETGGTSNAAHPNDPATASARPAPPPHPVPARVAYARVDGVRAGRPVSVVVEHDGTVDGDGDLARDVGGATGGDPSPDPLAVTVAVARGCDAVVSVVVYAAGRRCWCRRPGTPAAAACTCTAVGTATAMAGDLFEVETFDRGDVRIVRLRGELDFSNRTLVEQALADSAGHAVVVDLSDLTFIDAGGVSAILMAKQALDAEGGCVVRGATGNVRRVFRLADVEHLLED